MATRSSSVSTEPLQVVREKPDFPAKTNRTEVRMYAVIRSGHNGFMEWLAELVDGEVLRRESPRWIKGYIYKIWRESSGSVRDLYIQDVQSTNLETVRESLDSNEWESFHGISESVKEVLLLRDPYNCIASIMRFFNLKYYNEESVRLFVGLWKEHAEEFLRPNLVKGAVRCSFTRWFKELDYRKSIATELGLPFNDRGFMRLGMTSSFQREEEDVRKLDLFNRWREVLGTPFYASAMDDGLHEMATEIFGETIAEARDTIRGA